MWHPKKSVANLETKEKKYRIRGNSALALVTKQSVQPISRFHEQLHWRSVCRIFLPSDGGEVWMSCVGQGFGYWGVLHFGMQVKWQDGPAQGWIICGFLEVKNHDSIKLFIIFIACLPWWNSAVYSIGFPSSFPSGMDCIHTRLAFARLLYQARDTSKILPQIWSFHITWLYFQRDVLGILHISCLFLDLSSNALENTHAQS